MSFASFQDEIYADGLAGVLPSLPIAYSALEVRGRRALLAEADLIMAVDGYRTLADLTPEALRRTPVPC